MFCTFEVGNLSNTFCIFSARLIFLWVKATIFGSKLTILLFLLRSDSRSNKTFSKNWIFLKINRNSIFNPFYTWKNCTDIVGKALSSTLPSESSFFTVTTKRVKYKYPLGAGQNNENHSHQVMPKIIFNHSQ